MTIPKKVQYLKFTTLGAYERIFLSGIDNYIAQLILRNIIRTIMWLY